MDVGKAGGNEAHWHELRAALCALHGAEFAGPIVDVLEQVMVDGAEMRQIERANSNTFGRALRCQHPFKPVEHPLAFETKLVLQNAGSRIDVRVIIGHDRSFSRKCLACSS